MMRYIEPQKTIGGTKRARMGELSAQDADAMWQPVNEQLSLDVADSNPQHKSHQIQIGAAAMDRIVQQASIGELTSFEVETAWQALRERWSLDGASGLPELSSIRPNSTIATMDPTSKQADRGQTTGSKVSVVHNASARLQAHFYCKELGLSVRKAANACGVSKSSVHRWIKCPLD